MKPFLGFGILIPAFVLPFPAASQTLDSIPPAFSRSVSFNGLFYLTYEEADFGGDRTSQFFIHRGYLTTNFAILPKLSGRITFDTSQDLEGDGRGDMEVRLKYAYAKYHLGDWGSLRGMTLEGGIVHMVWLDFEEHVNLYRMRDPMFLERSGIFNSADFGLTLGGGFGEDLPEEYRKSVSSAYASRIGSFAVGVYNGTGYHGDERNKNKVLQGRLTVRPFPEVVPGLQLSGLAILGKGNRSGELGGIPDWRTFDLFLSYQDRWGTLTGQYMWGIGNQRGTWTSSSDPGEATDYSGYSLFGEGRPGGGWRVIGGFDRMERSTDPADRGFQRFHIGVGYDLGSQNVLLLDLDRRDWKEPALPTETRVRVVFQLKF
ncbi:MAG: hypothetical protein PVJ76_10610 [Gemmatimonadota bacterium]